MTPFLRKVLSMNWLLIGSMLALAVFGVIAIDSCTYMQPSPAYLLMWRKQTVWIGISTVAFIGLSLLDYRWIRRGALPMYVAGIVFLILTLLIGVKKDGARCWLHLGPIQFQPAQFAVIAGVLMLALFLSQFRAIHPMLKLLAAGVIVAAPALLILIQPDFGEFAVWIPILFAMLFMARMPLRYLIAVAIIGTGSLPVMYFFKLKPYQRERIVAFADPEINPQGAAWAVNQTLIAVGSGRWSGKGFKAPDTRVEQGYVPRTTVPNDYIFAAIGEQWGFVGGSILIACFGLLLGTCFYIMSRARDLLGLLLCVGITTLIFTHVFQNIGMTIGIMPVTGVPLPLISYSGSFVLMIMFGLGLINSVWVHRVRD
ncbi:MAG: FtsW/RodA/SpoVE family cell cycle protein [Verrucomicrobiota bacterium]